MSFYSNLFKRSPKDVRRLILVVTVVAIVALAIVSILIIELQKFRDSSLSADEKFRNLVALVGEKAVLPTDEVPTVATVSDPSKLVNDPFFKEAKVGDQVLIYNNAKKVILWRPSVEKIIQISWLTNE